MNRRRRLALLLVMVAACAASALAQGIGVWRNYTSLRDVRAVARSGNAYWAATGGGLFRWRDGSTDYQRFTNAEGLLSTVLTAVAVDPEGRVWSGSATGYIHVYHPSTGALQIVRDIASASQTNKQINAITIIGDTVLVCTEFGLSLFRRGKFEFGDTYTRFGNIPAGARLAVRSAMIAGGRLWAGITDAAAQNPLNRIASAPLDGRNLLAPESWTLEQVSPANPVPTVLAVAMGSLYAGTGSGLFVRQGTAWVEVPAFSGLSIVALAGSADRLVITTGVSRVYALDQTGSFTQLGGVVPFSPTSLTLNAGGAPVLGALGGGILTLADSVWTSHLPNGPGSNQFSSVTVDPNGVVWGASGSAFGAGMYRFDGTTWTSFSMSNSVLPANEVYRVSVACNGSVWGSSWGRGLVEFSGGGTSLDSAHIFNTNIGMAGIPADRAYVVTSNVVCDSRGNTWTSVLGAYNRNVLAVRRPDNTWRQLPLTLGGVPVTNMVDSPVDKVLAVDGQDNLWGVVLEPTAYRGVMSLQNQGAVDSVASVLLNADNGLPSSVVKTIVLDRDNALWIGTDRGIAIVLDPSNPRRAGAIAAYKPLLGITINTIAVDPLNQKWVGTPEGVVLLAPDGTQQLASFTVENTNGQLIENNVRSIAVDSRSGTVYFGTASGLASLTTTAAAPAETAGSLTVYPNPFRLPSASQLTIDGLQADSRIKVLTTGGTLVRDLGTPGGRIGFWDGKDERGELVASGIYFLIGYAEDGSVVRGKVAVLKK